MPAKYPLDALAPARVLAVGALLALAACQGGVQTTSGALYVAGYDAALGGAGIPEIFGSEIVGDPEEAGRVLDADPIRAAAAVEPILELPARFGIARILNATLTTIPEQEAVLWRALAERHAPLGEFVAVEPLIAALTRQSVTNPKTHPTYYYRDLGSLVGTIRLGAARQHLDAVLIYEVGANNGSSKLTPLAVADLTLVGGIVLPTRHHTVHGLGRAVLVDVRNGYPYGTANAEADLSGLSTSFDQSESKAGLRNAVVLGVVEALVPKVERMILDLQAELEAPSREAGPTTKAAAGGAAGAS